MVYNSYSRTKVIVRLSWCVIAHQFMKADGNADFKLHTFLTFIGDRGER
jgi:hypothetical protein